MYGMNGKPVEDLWREWEVKSKECKELREDKKRLNEELRKQGEVIEGLKKRVKELEGNLRNLAVADYLGMMERGKREMEHSERSCRTSDGFVEYLKNIPK